MRIEDLRNQGESFLKEVALTISIFFYYFIDIVGRA